MCASPPEVEIRMVITPNYEQSDHIWMMKNARNAMEKRFDLITDLLSTIESCTSVLEFNAGSLGIFASLIKNDLIRAQLKNYRFFDCHYDCQVACYPNNVDVKSQVPQISYSGQVGNIWEYEDIIPPRNRYKSDVVIVHYLSATPDEKIGGAIYQICRLASKCVVVVDYPPEVCKIDIPKVFSADLTHSEVNTNEFVFPAKVFSESIYYLAKNQPINPEQPVQL